MTDTLIWKVGPQAGGDPLCACCTEQQIRTSGKGDLQVPEWAELWRKTGQKGLLITSYNRLKKDSNRAITPVAGAVHVPAHLVLAGSPQAKQLCQLHAHLSLGQSCYRQKKCCVDMHRVTLVVFDSLQPCRLWPARLLCQGGGFFRQEYWSVLANTDCHTLLEHYISCCPSLQLLWVTGAARTPATQAAALPPPWPSQGQTQVLQGSLRSKPQRMIPWRGGNKTTIQTQGQCG